MQNIPKITAQKNILQYLKDDIFYHHKKQIISITSLITIVGIIYAFLASPWYEVKIKILPPNNDDNMLLREYASIAALAGVNIPMGGASYNLFYPDIIKSNFVLNNVLKHKFWIESINDSLSLFQFWGTKIDSTEENWKLKLFEKAKKKLLNEYIQVDIDDLTQMIILTITAPKDRNLSSEIANYLIQQIDFYNKTMRKTNEKEQRVFIESAITENTLKLKQKEQELINFEDRNKEIRSPKQKIEHESLQLDVSILRDIITDLKKQLTLVQIEEIKDTPTLNIIEKATKPYFKKKPKRLLIILLSLFLGLFSSISFIIIKNNWPVFTDNEKS